MSNKKKPGKRVPVTSPDWKFEPFGERDPKSLKGKFNLLGGAASVYREELFHVASLNRDIFPANEDMTRFVYGNTNKKVKFGKPRPLALRILDLTTDASGKIDAPKYHQFKEVFDFNLAIELAEDSLREHFISKKVKAPAVALGLWSGDDAENSKLSTIIYIHNGHKVRVGRGSPVEKKDVGKLEDPKSSIVLYVRDDIRAEVTNVLKKVDLPFPMSYASWDNLMDTLRPAKITEPAKLEPGI